MKYINLLFLFILTLIVPACTQKKRDIADTVPEYKTIVNASKKINDQLRLRLFSYGVNLDIKKNYREINGTDDFSAHYWSLHAKDTVVSVDEARSMLITATRILIEEINSDVKIRTSLTHYPITVDDLDVCIEFADELKINLGRGISGVSLRRGKIKYEKYAITEYTGKYPASGVHYDFHEESYESASLLNTALKN